MTTYPDEEVICGGNSRDMTTYPDEEVICGGNSRDMITEDTFQAALPDSSLLADEYSSPVSSGEDSDADEDGVCGRTFEADLPLFIPSDDEYASSISYSYSEEEDDEESDDDENAASIVGEENDVRLLDIYCDFQEGVDLFKSSKPSKQEWKASCPTEGETATSAWVHVYGFYDAETGVGGYGVIVRNMAAKPIAASVYFSLYGLTYLYQVLKGLDAGLKLALKHGCSSPRVICNSRVVVRLLRNIASGFCHTPNCSGTNVNNVCQSCTMSMVPHMTNGSFKHVAPLIDSLQGKLHSSNFSRQSRKWNKAAYYLAKQAKTTLLIYGWGFRYYKVDIKPEKFSVDLLDILWKDAYDSLYYNLDARDSICSQSI
ncbi:hypothetical protein MKX03_025000 [Papaver bracteatum]|nr:hypothetical protein MKX03_025000 [Papaver bracteatum]